MSINPLAIKYNEESGSLFSSFYLIRSEVFVQDRVDQINLQDEVKIITC